MSRDLPDGAAGPAPDPHQQPGRRSGAGASTALDAMLRKGAVPAPTPAPADPEGGATPQG